MIFTYAGYTARVDYVEQYECYRGEVLGIEDKIVFECDREEDIEIDFHDAIDRHLDFKKSLGLAK